MNFGRRRTCENDVRTFGARPAPPNFVAWPSPGYFPEPTSDFSHVTVAMSSGGQPIPITSRFDSGGDPALIWDVDPGYTLGQPDRR